MRLFDAYIFVDWSANNSRKIGKDSIWITEAIAQGRRLRLPLPDNGCLNAPTRAIAVDLIRARLAEHMFRERRVLVCFDFAYGYPDCGEFRKLAPNSLEFAQSVAALLQDQDDNRSNRFEVADHFNAIVNDPSREGPFWGHPSSWKNQPLRYLKSTKPKNWCSRTELAEFRIVENRLRSAGMRPFSAWQLFGNGSVGSQALLGLPRVIELKELFSEASAIWPFETGWTKSFSDEIRIVHAEFWPGLIDIDESLHRIRDAAQVKSCALWAATADASGHLSEYFDPMASDDPDRDRAEIEGWILGFSAIRSMQRSVRKGIKEA